MCEKTNVILDLHDINTDNIHVLEPIRNTIIQNGYFRRIIYSNEFMTLNNFNCTSQCIERQNSKVLPEIQVLYK